jgi:hypothetical protein
MSCFNTIHFKCPNCGADLEVQSKGGDCCLSDFNSLKVPIADAAYILNDEEFCEICHKKFKIISHVEYMPLYLIEVKEEIVDDDL